MINETEQIHTIALMQVPGIGVVWGRHLIEAMGSAENVFLRRKEIPDVMPEARPRVVDILNCPQAIAKAEEEYTFIRKNHIRCLTIHDPDYPSRLRECEDAPIVLYFKGSCNLNALHIINMVGTRNATDYGKQMCINFLRDLKQLCPDVLVVSGLAYGIDVCTHRAALQHKLPTVGVLAHGLDRIYPPAHRNTAIEMLEEGGLLTEFPSKTQPDRYNFISRNRIVAGMSDATIVVESAIKGGSLITAELAEGYHRECFAFSGRATDIYSQGCNRLIQQNKASLLQSAEDFVRMMNWENSLVPRKTKQTTVQRNLFPNLSEEEEKVVSLIASTDDTQINSLVVEMNIPIHKMSALLFELEMKGVVKALAGNRYELME
jgi:DNA processing protein